MKTQAVVAGKDGVVKLREVDLPPMSATRVRVKMLLSGVSCGTEADSASGVAAYMKRPFISGYQGVAKVVEVGRRVSKLKPGDVVATDGGGLWEMTNLYGGSHAREAVCEEARLVKFNARTGSMPTAAYATLAAVGYEAVTRMKLKPGNVLAVFGLGMLGQFAGKIAKLLGLRVVGVNRSAWKCEAAKRFGFDAVCPPDAGALRAAVRSVGGAEIRHVLDTTGKQSMFDLAVAAVGPHGELSLAGYHPEKFMVDFNLCHEKNLVIHNPVGYGKHIPSVVRLVNQGKLNAESLIRHRIRPGEISAFYANLIANHSKYLGVVIDWADKPSGP